MAIADYDTLRASVQSWTARNDSKMLGQFPTLVALTEDRIFDGAGADRDDPLYSPPVRAQIMEERQTITLTEGRGGLPARYLDMRRLNRVGSINEEIVYLPPPAFAAQTRTLTGIMPMYYTIEAQELITAPVYDGDLESLCYIRPLALGVSNQTNNMLTAYGSLYLMGCLHEAYTFMLDAEKAILFKEKRDQMAEELEDFQDDVAAPVSIRIMGVVV